MSNEYRKKPVVIQAVQFTEELRDSILFDKQPCPAGVIAAGSHTHPGTRKVWSADFYIETLEGRMRVEVGDWIITGVKGEHYPCRDDIFRMTYEPVEDGDYYSEEADDIEQSRARAADEVTDAQRLAWLLPNLHPANFGMEFPGGYEWEDEADYLRKWRGAIDAAMQKDTQ
jgi:hypothetical protein